MTLDPKEDLVRQLLLAIGEDPDRDGLKDTPDRVVRSWQELYAGYNDDPKEILAKRFRATSSRMVCLNGIDYFSMCVPSKQIVNTVGGARPASKVEVGDQFWTLHHGRCVETTVSKVSSHKTRSLVEVTTERGSFCLTPDHPLATPEGWVEAGEAEGCLVEWTNPKALCRNRHPPRLGYGLGYVIGATFSDGTTGDRYVSLVVNEQWFAEKYALCLEEAFGIEADVEPVTRPSGFTGRETPGFRVRVVSSYLADLMRMWAGGDANHMRQRFPRVVLSSFECTQGFIDGYVDGDGCRSNSGTGSLVVSSNQEFLTEMAEVIDARFTPAENGSSQLYVSDRWWRPGWYGKHGFRQEDHRTDLIESTWVKVLSVRPLPESKKPYTVYSFTCEPYPTFLVAGHLTHNCEHHMLPFHGTVDIAYIPKDYVVGISKFARLVNCFARRLQIQEQMTNQICEAINEHVETDGVAVRVQGKHTCMCGRGVMARGANMVTFAEAGKFADDVHLLHRWESSLPGPER